MKISIHQPSLFPWLGLLDKIARTESFVFLDDVAANKASYQYRNQFFCTGSSKFISLPVNYSLGIKLNELKYKNNLWADDHLNKLKNYYLKTPFFEEIFAELQLFYAQNKDKEPIEFLIQSMHFSFQLFGINVKTLRSSQIKYYGTKGELVLSICRALNADTYLSGQGAKDYLDDGILNKFRLSGINLEWHSFVHPKYPQHHKFDFVEGLSCLDILFFNGITKSKEIFWNSIK